MTEMHTGLPPRKFCPRHCWEMKITTSHGSHGQEEGPRRAVPGLTRAHARHDPSPAADTGSCFRVSCGHFPYSFMNSRARLGDPKAPLALPSLSLKLSYATGCTLLEQIKSRISKRAQDHNLV